MNRWLRYVSLTAVLFTLVLIGSAQDEIYTFESGVQFTIPEGVTLDESGNIPVLSIGDFAVMDVVDPNIIGQTPDATLDMPLDDVMDFLLNAVGYTEERTEDATSLFDLPDGREVLAYNFVNSSGAVQTIFTVRLSDGRIGALNFRTVEEVDQDTIDTVYAILFSLDIPGGLTEEALVAELEESFTYETGVSFSYPEEFIIANEDNPPVTIGIDEELLITMVDPNIVGMPAGEPMGDVIGFAIENKPLEVTDFSDFDIGGREAVIGTTEDDELTATMILVRFSDETVGIMDILTIGDPTDEHIEYLRQVAASFNSDSDEASITSADIDEARALFEEAMGLRDEGDYESAIDLFTQSIELNPNLALAYYWRGATYQRTGDVESSVTDYRQALKLAPDQTQISEDIAEVYALYGDVDSAIAELETLIEEVGEDTVDPSQLDALEVYREIADGEYVSDFYFAQANRLREYEQYELALASSDILLENEPDDPDLHSQRGVILLESGDAESAIESFTTAIELEPKPLYFYNRGYAYSQTEDGLLNFVEKVHDYQCVVLLADNSVSQEQIDFAQRGIDLTIISSDTYEPITDPEDCGA